MKKEVVMATAIAGLLSSLSAAEVAPKVDMNKVTIDKKGKVIAPKDVKYKTKQKGIKGIKGDEGVPIANPVACQIMCGSCQSFPEPGKDVTKKSKVRT